MKNYKCLVVSGPFVPTNEPMTMVSYKNLRCLSFEYDVIVLKYKKDITLDKKLINDPKFNKFNIIDAGNYNKVLFSIKNIFLPIALFHMKEYIEFCIRQFESNSYEFLYTSSFPAYTTRVGYELKMKKHKFCWIASFTDPINNSPYKPNKRTNADYDIIHRIAFNIYCKYYVRDADEIIAIENADILVFICEEQRDFMIEQYIKKRFKLSEHQIIAKSVIFPLSYVKEWNDVPNVEARVKDNDKIICSHFGRVYGLRKIDNFIRAISELVNEYSFLKERLIIKQFGQFRKTDLKLIKSLNLEKYFEFYDKIPYDKCLEEMANSDILLIFDTIIEDTEWQPYLPSKILEYSLIQKDVFALTTKRSPTYRIMKNSNTYCAVDDIKSIKEEFMSLIENGNSKVEYRNENEIASKALQEKIKDIKERRKL